jgi:site-specific DNA recombinase
LAADANEKFVPFLKAIEIGPKVSKLYSRIFSDSLKGTQADGKGEAKKLESAIHKIALRKHSIQDLLADRTISPTQYSEMKERYDEEERELVAQKAEVAAGTGEIQQQVKSSISLIGNLVNSLYQIAPIEHKQKIVGSIFTAKLIFNGKNYRTTKLNEVIELFRRIDKGFGGKKKGTNSGNLNSSPGVESERA